MPPSHSHPTQEVPSHAASTKAGCPPTTPQSHPPHSSDRVFLGADAIKLFPSLEQKQVAKLVAQAFLDSDVKVANVDYKELAKYIAVNWQVGRIRMEGLHKVCPKRKKTKGRKPSVSGKEQAKSKSTEEEDSLWSSPTREPTTLEKRKLLACMLEIGIVASFGLHIYSFAGKIYQQKVGGPIGSRLTMAVSQVVMALLGAKLKKYLTQGEIQIFLEACYVDDLRFILSLLPSYMAWDRQTKMFVDARSTQNPCTQTPPQKSQAKQYPTPKRAAHQTPPPPHLQAPKSS